MKKIIEKFKSIDKGTLIRTLLLTISYINQLIAVIGVSSYANNISYQIISAIATVVVSAVAAWKNNDFTHLAQLSGSVLKALKDGKVNEDEIKSLLDKANENLK